MIFLESILSDGNQYIDTGFCPDQNTRLVLDVQVTSTGLAALFGARSGYKSNAFALFTSQSYLQDDFGTASGNVTLSGVGRHVFEKKQNLLSVDGVVVRTAESNNFTCPYPVALLSINNGGVMMTAYPVTAAIYSAQIYDGETLVRDLVPALDDSGIPGLYDKCSGGFYRNAGTGAFTAGTVLSRVFAAEFRGLSAGTAYCARVYPMNPQGSFQSELTGQTAVSSTEQ